MVHSYHNGRNSKFSLGLQLLLIGKKDAGTLYIPQEHRGFVERVYQSLSMAFQTVLKDSSRQKGMPPVSELFIQPDSQQNSLEICIRHTGADLPERLKEIHAIYPLAGKWTA